MNRNQRRFGRAPRRNESENWSKGRPRNVADQNGLEFEEVLPPRSSRKGEKLMTNRCCYITPSQKEFGQLTDSSDRDQYQSILLEQYGFNPIIPDTLSQLHALRKVLCGSCHKVDNSSQYTRQSSNFLETSDGAHWQNVDNTDDIERFILQQGKDEETVTTTNQSRNIQISEVPRVKIIAEKFSRYKENNVELRKLDEKVVCVEYDVFDQVLDDSKAIQVMRAFFSIRPVYDEKNDKTLTQLPPQIKNKFNITFEDLQKLSEKEVEIIDSKIAENRPYLDDLRKILRRKPISSKKNSLNLQTLYEMATMEYLNIDRDHRNVLSKEELQEVKNLILKRCKSSVHGINRRTVKRESETDDARGTEKSAVSQCLVAELLREEAKMNVLI